MSQHVVKHYEKVVEKLERLEKQVYHRRSYCEESRNLRLLIELIKEQLPNENIGNTARALR